MPYEVVSPGQHGDRGEFYPSLTLAMGAASPTLEVWELDDDMDRTRMVKVWPDPEFEPAADLEEKRTERFVREHIGRAEREATALLADHNPVSPDKVHALVSLAWGRGFVAGFGTGTETFADALNRIGGER